MTAHYKLTEDDEVLIYEARYQLQFVLDITCSVPPGKQLTLDPEGLAAFLSSVQRKLPEGKNMAFVVE